MGNKKYAIPKEYGIEGFRTIPKRWFKATGGSLHPLETSKDKNPVTAKGGIFCFYFILGRKS
jgi:hypothetical protein